MAYNPGESRDKNGKWTTGGGGGSAPKESGKSHVHKGTFPQRSAGRSIVAGVARRGARVDNFGTVIRHTILGQERAFTAVHNSTRSGKLVSNTFGRAEKRAVAIGMKRAGKHRGHR